MRQKFIYKCGRQPLFSRRFACECILPVLLMMALTSCRGPKYHPAETESAATVSTEENTQGHTPDHIQESTNAGFPGSAQDLIPENAYQHLPADTGDQTREASEDIQYRFAADRAFAPFSEETEETDREDDKLRGMSVELLQAIAAEQNISYEIVPMDFSAILPSVISGGSDAALAVALTSERAEKLNFSDSYAEGSLCLVIGDRSWKPETDSNGILPEESIPDVYSDGTTEEIAGVEDLLDKTVAVREGTVAAEWAEKNRERYGFTINTLQDLPSMEEAIRDGEADAFIEEKTAVSYQLRNGELAGLKICEDLETTVELAFAVDKGQNAGLLEKLNRGLKALKDSGEYSEILKRYQD
jgi:glutamine transport system substrate-binding protein